MRMEWLYGFGALSTLVVLVGLDLLVAIAEREGVAASAALLRELRPQRARRG